MMCLLLYIRNTAANHCSWIFVLAQIWYAATFAHRAIGCVLYLLHKDVIGGGVVVA